MLGKKRGIERDEEGNEEEGELKEKGKKKDGEEEEKEMCCGRKDEESVRTASWSASFQLLCNSLHVGEHVLLLEYNYKLS